MAVVFSTSVRNKDSLFVYNIPDLAILRKSCFKTRKSSKTSALSNIYGITIELEFISQLFVHSLC